MKLTLLGDIPDEHLFWSGAAFRRMKAGMNGVSSDQDFYDYMLVRLDDDKQSMLLVNVTVGNIKAGAVVCYVARASENFNTVTAKALRWALGVENIYYIEEA